MQPAGLATMRSLRPAQPRVAGRVAPGARPLLGLVPARQRQQPQQQPQQLGDKQVCANAAAGAAAFNDPAMGGDAAEADTSALRMPDAARRSLGRATNALRRYGWLGFWSQLAVSIISGVILLFSVAFTSQGGPKVSLYLTLVGILAGFLSTFWNFGYLRTANRMQDYLNGADVAKVKKQAVIDMLTRGVMINVAGLGATLLGIQTMVGMLVAKTLSNASVNPFMASAAAGYNPVLALDVFLVQAASNTLLGHFLSLLFSLWLLNVVGEGRGLRFQQRMRIDQLREQGAERERKFSTLSGAVVDNTATGDDDWPFGGGGGAGRGTGRNAAVSASGGVRSAVPVPGPAGAKYAAVTGDDVLVGAEKARFALAKTANSAAKLTNAAAAASNQAVATMRESGLRGLADSALDLGNRSGAGVGLVKSAPQLMAGPLVTGGRVPGDLGFDPLGLYKSSNQGTGNLMDPKWLSYAEVIHGRWAMLAAAGCLAPEVLAGAHIIPAQTGVAWFRTGFLPDEGQLSWVHNYGALFTLQMVLMGGAEGARLSEYLEPGSAQKRLVELGAAPDSAAAFSAPEGSPAYPGGPVFNPLRIAPNKRVMEEFKLAEIKHGRLAMLAMAGFGAQAVLTRAGPWANLVDHMASPLANNVLTSLQQPMGGVAKTALVVTSALVGAVAAAALPSISDLASRRQATSE